MGIGRQHSKRLQALNVRTVYQFTQLHDDWVRKHMTVQGLRLKHDLQGSSSIDFEVVQPKKSIAVTRSFDTMYTTQDAIAERVATLRRVVARSCVSNIHMPM